MANRTIQLDDDIYNYILSVTLSEPSLFRRLREETARLPNARMQIAPEQGQFMALLARLMGARRALEIGTFTGYSALWTASALPADGYLLACDVSEEWTAVARRFWREAGLENKIELRLAPAIDTLDDLLRDPPELFDFAFIDADKTAYLDYYQRVMRLLRPGGLVLFDNALSHGDVADESKDSDRVRAIRRTNLEVCRDPRVDAAMVPIGDGLLLARKKG